jgi:hypothetical protein
MYLEWEAVALFYAAVHYINGYFETKGLVVSNHREREDWINRDATLRPTYTAYRYLYTDSRSARYFGGTFSQPRIQDRRRDLQTIKRALRIRPDNSG